MDRFAEREGRLLKEWDGRGIYGKAKKQREKGRKFYFLQGPPFTSGEAHLGHAWNHAIKDSVLRQRRMCGYNVYDRAGWDCHGLPVELKVEQRLGMKSKRDIEAIGMERFARECESFVEWSRARMAGTFKRMAVWLGWDDPYLTYSNGFMESVWFLIKKAHEKNLLYKGERVVSWCWRCVTALAANYEVEYKEVEDPSIFVKFPVKGKEDEYIIVWTTTPWTLPANVAVIVHPDFEYAFVDVTFRENREKWILAKELVEKVCGKYCKEYKITETLKGSRLGFRYVHPLLEEIPVHKRFFEDGLSHFVRQGAIVTLEDGSGCVHTAPGHGKEDFEVGQKYGLPVFCPVDEHGRFTEDGGKYKGMFVKEADKVIVNDLDEKGLLVASEKIRHNYLHCERCKQPIIYRATEQWFIAISRLRTKLLKENESIKWVPGFIGTNRFGKWLEGVEDWCISRQRYWNTPLPVWVCPEKHLTVVGSVAELEKLSGSRVENLHRPWIDRVTIKCQKCGKESQRVKDVMDVWLDSGSASWATLGYPSSDRELKRLWPVDFITEGSDQTRGWFYSLLGCSVIAFDKTSYRSVLYHGFTVDVEGRKMSKSLGNGVAPEEIMEKHGVDAMRFYLLWSNVPWEDLKFAWDDVKQAERFLNILWNVFSFYVTYSKACAIVEPKAAGMKTEDEWILSATNRLAEDVTKAYDDYLPHMYTRPIEKFVLEDLSRLYVKLIRSRTWPSYKEKDREGAFYALREVLMTLSKLLAPVCPFIAEDIYLGLGGRGESVHLEDWPKPGKRKKGLEESMATAKEVIEAINSVRQEKNIGLRYPVKEATITGGPELVKSVKSLERIVMDIANLKSLGFGEARFDVEVKLNYSVAGKKFGKKVREMEQALSGADKRKIAEDIEKGKKVRLAGEELGKDDLRIEKRIPEGLAGKTFPGGVVYLDTSETKEIIEESFVRELIRNVQEQRKEMKLRVEQRVEISVYCTDDAKRTIEKWGQEIKDSTGASGIIWSGGEGTEASYKGLKATFSLRVVG